MGKILRIGLTGGIGSGKSTVCEIFSGLGVPVIDADQITHELSARGQPAYLAIIRQFGNSIVRPDGELDRGRIRKIIFRDETTRHNLEGILHPLIYNEIERRVSRLDHGYCIICIPLLIETGATGKVDRILVVDAPVDLQMERARTRDSMDDELVASIINAQVTRKERLNIADDIITNNGDIDSLKQQIYTLNEKYKNITGKPATD
jgi:dephospho-CoA kinase